MSVDLTEGRRLPGAGRAVRREVLLVLGVAVLLTVVLSFAGAVIAVRVLNPYAVFVVGLVIGLAWRGLAALRRRTPPPDAPVVELSRVWPYSGAFARIGHLEYLLDFVASDARYFRRGLRPLLVELADDRLRRHHDVDRRTRPDLAERIVGEDLWTLMTQDDADAKGAIPTGTQLRTWIRRIEEL